MRARISALLAAVAVCFLTLLIVVLNAQVKVSAPASLYAEGENAWLQVAGAGAYAELKGNAYYSLTDPATGSTWRAYRDTKAKALAGTVIALAAGGGNGLGAGWHPVSVALRSESFYEHYLAPR